ncbi:MAG TPA: hypothetical protein VNY70_05010 [Steroidobacteraceae bacterium]|nr:hypothetical protein [Steroidobacteraceae bacterium]
MREVLRGGAARLVAALAIAALSGAPAAAAPGSDAARAAYEAGMQGRKADTLAAVQALAADLPIDRVIAAGGSGWALTPEYAALVRFGLWDELIALGPPDARAPGLTAGYLFGRGVALAARGRLAEARDTLSALARLDADTHARATVSLDPLHEVIEVALPVVAARIAATELRTGDSIRELEQAAAAEDRLSGGAGADWFFPVRHLLGAELLVAGDAVAAERVYREDLRRHPDNGWALFGLAAALRAEGKRPAAAAAGRAFAQAWQHADVRLASSAFWFAGPDSTSCECQRQAAD